MALGECRSQATSSSSGRRIQRVRSILDNAQSHAISQYLLRMDFVDFFGSITRDDIVRYITENAVHFTSWTGEDVELFCRLVCRTDALTIGAPTSPALSNVVCYELDVRLHAVAERHGATYARYADDLFFSTSAKDILVVVEKRVQEMVRDLELPGNLRINESKTRHSSKRGARRVTGLILGSDGRVYIGRKRKREIRALVHSYESLDLVERASLAGKIAYAIGLDPGFMNSLINKYASHGFDSQ